MREREREKVDIMGENIREEKEKKREEDVKWQHLGRGGWIKKILS